MKRKALIILLFIISISSLFGGCGIKDKNRMQFIITNNCNHEIYGINFKYYIGDKLVYSGGVQNFNRKDIKIGDEAKVSILPKEIPRDKDLSNLKIKYFVVLGDKTEEPCQNEVRLKAKYGGIYKFSLEGSIQNGFYIKQEK